MSPFLLQAKGLFENHPILAGIAILVSAILVLFGFIFFLNFGSLYIQALFSGCKTPVKVFVGMWLRKVQPSTIINSLITATKAGIKDVQLDKLEAHFLARGNVNRVVNALVAANKANIALSFDQAAAIDLAGRDVYDAVRTSVQPKVIDCPNPEGGRTTVDAVAGDGIQLKAKARVTVRTNLSRLVGGATEETIIARVGEGIVTTIGSAATHKSVLANPDLISKTVLSKGLDAGTAYEILSIDIADVDVGENIGAKLQAEQAESDKRVAQALAEKRRALAVAQEQENIAEIAANRAKLVLAEAEVPRSIADAFRKGHLGIMDYYRMKNIQADTTMREQIGRDPAKDKDELHG
ncbi:MAG: flotillin-like protein FloA [Planctomycetes bacterium]|nr:flotillin-like protein FloA [Planctomycetota bacterium]